MGEMDFDTKAPYDEVLDLIMTSRGWWSYRQSLGSNPSREFYCDLWQSRSDMRQISVQCLGSEAYRIDITDRLESGFTRITSEILTSRHAVISRITDLE